MNRAVRLIFCLNEKKNQKSVTSVKGLLHMIDLDECSFDIPETLFGRMFFVDEFVTFRDPHHSQM